MRVPNTESGLSTDANFLAGNAAMTSVSTTSHWSPSHVSLLGLLKLTETATFAGYMSGCLIMPDFVERFGEANASGVIELSPVRQSEITSLLSAVSDLACALDC